MIKDHNFITILESNRPVNKIASETKDGFTTKAVGMLSEYKATTVRVDNPQQMLDLFEQDVCSNPNACVVYGFVPGTRPECDEKAGKPFYLYSMKRLKRAQEEGVVREVGGRFEMDDPEGGPAAVRVTTRTKDVFAPSSWMMIDRDTDEHMPFEMRNMSRDEFFEFLESLLPGISTTGGVLMPSTKSRIVCKDEVNDSPNFHLVVQINDPYRVSSDFGKTLLIRATANGHGYTKPSFRRKTGKLITNLRRTAIDCCVFQWNRVSFDGAPFIAKSNKNLKLLPPALELREGDVLNLSRVPVLTEAEINAYKPKKQGRVKTTITKVRKKIERTISDGSTRTVTVDQIIETIDGQITLDTPIRLPDGDGTTTLREFHAKGLEHQRTEAPFREDSTSENGFISRFDSGIPFAHDNGEHINYTLSLEEERELAEFDVPANLFPVADIDEPVSINHQNMPKLVADYANTVGRKIGVDAGAVALSALCVTSSLVPSSVIVQVRQNDPDWVEPILLWVALVADPSVKKTPALLPMKQYVDCAEAKLHDEYRLAKERYDAEHAVWANASVKDGFGKKAGDPEPKAPVHKRLMVGNTTVEAVHGLLGQNKDGEVPALHGKILVMNDELSGWLGSLDQYKGNTAGSADKAFWLEAFNMGGYKVDRVLKGHVWLPSSLAAVLGGIQPNEMRKLAKNMNDDGMVQRFIPVRVVQNDLVGVDENTRSLSDELRLIMDGLMGLENRRLRFSKEANELLLDVQKLYATEAQYGGHPMGMQAALGKYGAIVPRLAALFHLLEAKPGFAEPRDLSGSPTPRNDEINLETLQMACNLVEHFLLPELRWFYEDLMATTEEKTLERELADIILMKELETVTIRDVEQWKSLRGKRNEVRAAMRWLADNSWVLPVGESVGAGPNKWRVNPAVHEMFAERAVTENAKRKKNQEMIRLAGETRIRLNRAI